MTPPSGNDPVRFVLGTRPRADESLPGYLMRLATRVGARADRIAGMAGLRQPGSAVRAADLTRLSALASMSLHDLETLAYPPTARFAHHRFGGGSLHRDMLDISSRRACPACLERSAFHRRSWDVALLTSCPDHGIRLVGRCPSCSRSLGWADPAVAACRCGGDVRLWPRVPVDARESGTGTRLLELARGGPGGWLPRALQACDPADLIRLAMSLGMFITSWHGGRRPETLVKAGADAVARVTVAGVAALECWPGPLLAFLEGKRRRAGERSGRYGAGKTIGPFYGWLRDVEPSAMKEALVTVVQRSVGLDPVGAHRMHRSDLLAASRTVGPGFVNLKQAAAMLGRSTTTTKRMLADVCLPETRPGGRGMPTVLDLAAVRSVVLVEEGQLTLRDVAVRLGVAKGRTRRLLEAGLVHVRHRALHDPSGRWAVDTAAVDGFLCAMRSSVVSRPGERLGGFDYAVEAARRRGIDMAEMLRRVQDGRLRPAALDRTAVGIRQLMFARRDIVAIGTASSPGRCLTIQETARRLGLKWQVVNHLVRRGIPEAALEAFRVDYVSGAELARIHRTSPRALAASLAEAGVVPVSGPGVDGGRQNFFARPADVRGW